MEERVYPLRTGFKVFCWIMAAICLLIPPLAIALIWIVFKAEIRMTDAHLVVKWFGTRTIPWGEISNLQPARAQGVVGAMMMPHTYTLKSGKSGNIAVGAHKETQEILAEIARRAGRA